MMEFEFGQQKSPYMDRRDRIFGRPNGRPVGSTGAITGQVKQPDATTPTGSGISGTMQQSPYARFLGGLAKPIPYQDQSQQRWNLARGREQSITKLGLEQGQKYFGGRNLLPGESGIAEAGMGKIAIAGMERMSRASRQVALDEADRRKEYDMMNLQRAIGGAGLALHGEEGALNRQFGYYRSKLGAEQSEWDAWRQTVAGGYGG